MSDKNYKDEYKKLLEDRPKVRISKIMQLKRENPHMMYAGVRIDRDFDPNGLVLEEYLNNNWSYVTDQEVDDDYRSLKQKDESDKPSPLIEKGRGGAVFCYVCKSKDQWLKDETARARRDQDRLFNKQGRKTTRKGNDFVIEDPELNENNINNQSNFEE
jgi:hypothetical protein